MRYESDFSPPFNNRNGENADVSRVINGYNTGRWWPLWGKIVPYGDPLMVIHTHTHTHTRKHTHTHIYVRVYMYVRVDIYMYV